MSESQPPPVQSPSKGGGCLTPLLLVLFLVTFLGGGAVFLGLRYAADKVIEKISQTSPASLPELHLSSEQIESVKSRLREFQEAVDKDQKGVTLTLQGEELQAALLTFEAKELQTWKDRVFVSIYEDRLRCDVSFPAGRILLKDYPGKFINGFIEIKLHNPSPGDVHVSMESARLGDYELPKDMLGGTGSNLLEMGPVNKKETEQFELFLRKVSKAEIAGGTLTIILK
jgi:hypothetical protein